MKLHPQCFLSNFCYSFSWFLKFTTFPSILQTFSKSKHILLQFLLQHGACSSLFCSFWHRHKLHKRRSSIYFPSTTIPTKFDSILKGLLSIVWRCSYKTRKCIHIFIFWRRDTGTYFNVIPIVTTHRLETTKRWIMYSACLLIFLILISISNWAYS